MRFGFTAPTIPISKDFRPEPESVGERFSKTARETIIGRDRFNNLGLRPFGFIRAGSRYISKRHLSLKLDDANKTLTVEDLNSTNGSFLMTAADDSFHRITEPVELSFEEPWEVRLAGTDTDSPFIMENKVRERDGLKEMNLVITGNIVDSDSLFMADNARELVRSSSRLSLLHKPFELKQDSSAAGSQLSQVS